MERRIIDLAEKSSLGIGDFLVVDNDGGTRKVNASAIMTPIMNLESDFSNISLVLPDQVQVVSVSLNQSFTAGTYKDVDFTTLVTQNCPDDYKFLNIEFAGAWPLTTWANAYVSLVRINGKVISLLSMSSQNYNVHAHIYYIRDL